MKALMQAIWTKFNAGSDFKTAISGRLYNNEAPQNPTFPYATYHLIDNNPEFEMGSVTNEDFSVQFSIFDDDSSAGDIGDLFENLKSLFDDAVLSVSGYNNIEFERDTTIGPVRDKVYKTWAYHVDYNIYLEDQP